MICRTCGNRFFHEKFKNCEYCRWIWRQKQRKPDGYKNTIEKLQKENKKLADQITALEAELNHFRLLPPTSASGSDGGSHSKNGGSESVLCENWRK